MDTDEFLIKAIGHPSEPDREWTRSHLITAKVIADAATGRLGYGKAWVVNTYGGHVSDPLHVSRREGYEDECCPMWIDGHCPEHGS